MKFLSLAVFAGAVMGQASVISDAISNIQSKTEALDSAVNAFSGPSDITALQNAATAVVSAITQGNTNVQGIDAIDSTSALSLVSPINDLAGAVHTSVNDLIAKKSALSAETSVVNKNLNSILDATQTFSATTISKVPTALQSTAQSLVQPIIDDLNRAIAAFPAGSGSTSSSSASASSSAVSSTTASASATASGSVTTTAPVYSMSSAAVETMVTSASTSVSGSIIVVSTSVSPPITSQTSSPAPYNPNGASQLTGGFAAVIVAAAVAVAAF